VTLGPEQELGEQDGAAFDARAHQCSTSFLFGRERPTSTKQQRQYKLAWRGETAAYCQREQHDLTFVTVKSSGDTRASNQRCGECQAARSFVHMHGDDMTCKATSRPAAALLVLATRMIRCDPTRTYVPAARRRAA
jgi:hypothetical protein